VGDRQRVCGEAGRGGGGGATLAEGGGRWVVPKGRKGVKRGGGEVRRGRWNHVEKDSSGEEHSQATRDSCEVKEDL
jgi:hypothetical protein